MHLVLTAVVPIIAILALGAVLRHRILTDAGLWRGLEWLSYRVFTPSLFVVSIATTSLEELSTGPLVFSIAIPVVVVSIALVASRRLLRANGPQLTSLVQGSIRINTYIGLIFASALNGTEGVATFALAAAVMVPLVNVISVTVLSVHGRRAGDRPRSRLWRHITGNPLIQACALGLMLNISGVGLPELIAGPLTMLAQPALVAGTLVAGAAVTLRLSIRDSVDIALSSTIKLIVLPLAAGALATAVGVSPIGLVAVVLICAVPTAPSAYVLAALMGGDTRLMASIASIQTVLSMATLPLILNATSAL